VTLNSTALLVFTEMHLRHSIIALTRRAGTKLSEDIYRTPSPSQSSTKRLGGNNTTPDNINRSPMSQVCQCSRSVSPL